MEKMSLISTYPTSTIELQYQKLTLFCLFLILCVCFPVNAYAINRIKEVKHEVLPNETQAEIVFYEKLDSPVQDYKDKNGLALILKDVIVDPPKWKFVIQDKKVLKNILISQENGKNAKILFHVMNPGRPIPYTIATSKSRKSITVSLKHPTFLENKSKVIQDIPHPSDDSADVMKSKSKQTETKDVYKSEVLEPYEEPRAPMAPDTLSLLLRTGSALAMVIGVIFLAAFVVKKFFPQVLKNSYQNDNFKIIDKHSLGQRKQIVLVKLYGRKLLLGVTPSQINLLAELEEEENKEILIKTQEKEPFNTQLSGISKEIESTANNTEKVNKVNYQAAIDVYKDRMGEGGATVAEALSKLDKDKGIDVGGHKKSLENALSVLQNKIKQFSDK